MKRMIAGLIALVLALTFVGCGKEAEETTTVSGMVTEINGTVISLMEMDSNPGGNRQEGAERPPRPENMEGFENFGGFENFEGTEGEIPQLPEGEMPQRPEGEIPQRPEGEMPQLPEGKIPQRPAGGATPDMPTDGSGSRPFGDGQMPDFGGETTQIDIGNAHISVEDGDIKASGSLSDITVGCFVTVTRNAKGEVTNVLVTANAGFGGQGGFRDFGNFDGNRGKK